MHPHLRKECCRLQSLYPTLHSSCFFIQPQFLRFSFLSFSVTQRNRTTATQLKSDLHQNPAQLFIALQRSTTGSPSPPYSAPLRSVFSSLHRSSQRRIPARAGMQRPPTMSRLNTAEGEREGVIQQMRGLPPQKSRPRRLQRVATARGRCAHTLPTPPPSQLTPRTRQGKAAPPPGGSRVSRPFLIGC